MSVAACSFPPPEPLMVALRLALSRLLRACGEFCHALAWRVAP